MRLKFFFAIFAILFLVTQPSFSAYKGCFTQKKIDQKSEKACIDQKFMNSVPCWVESEKACYQVPYIAECYCIQNKGQVCNADLGNGGSFGYCRWGDKGLDIWRYYWKELKKPVQIKDPPDVVDICKLLGGEAEVTPDPSGKIRGMCIDFIDGGRKRATCPLEKLWKVDCKHSLVVPDSKKK